MPAAPRRIGPYELLGELGRGGVGVVFRARRADVPRPVALKLILRGRADARALGRFEREAHALAKVRHPNVVLVHELGHAEEGPYLVTELVDGQPLDALCEGQPMDPRRAAEIARDLAGALAAIHEAGVVHRDLKPGNVLLRSDGSPVLLDFGLARDTESGDRLTQTGMITGTPSYMSPEQATGESAANPDPRTDVYGLGATLYTLLTGDAPFVGSSIHILASIVSSSPDWPGVKALPPGLVAICQRAMSRGLGERHASAGELRDDLVCWLGGDYRVARSLTAPLALLGGLLVAAAALALAFGQTGDPKARLDSSQLSASTSGTRATTKVKVKNPTPRPLGRWTRVAKLNQTVDARRGPQLAAFVTESRFVEVEAWAEELAVWELAGEARVTRTLRLSDSIQRLVVANGLAVMLASSRPAVLVVDVSGEGELIERAIDVALSPAEGRQNFLQGLGVDAAGRIVVVGDNGGGVHAIDLTTGKVVATRTHSASNGVAAVDVRDGVAVTTSSANDSASIDGSAMGHLDFRVRFWSLPDLTLQAEFPVPTIGVRVRFANGVGEIYFGTLGGRVQRWSRAGKMTQALKGRHVTEPPRRGNRWAVGADEPRAHSNRIEDLRLGPRYLYSLARAPDLNESDAESEFKVWDLETGEDVSVLQGLRLRRMSGFALSPSSRRLVVCSWHGDMELWTR